MFECYRSLFLYAVTPVHMGAGTALGLIDSPIQRERHTEFPMVSGSGLKGAIRHALSNDSETRKTVERYFGPEAAGEDLGAGAVSLTDAQIVLYPVQNPRRAFSYVTSPLALSRLGRLLDMAGISVPELSSLMVKEGEALVSSKAVLFNDRDLVLESLTFSGAVSDKALKAAEWLSAHALPAGESHGYFREKIKEGLVVLSDSDFSYLVRNTTSVEPHVRIDQESGTAEDGGLFYVENLPPESLLVALAMSSRERPARKSNSRELSSAREVIQWLAEKLNDRPLQIGGDATTGRGQVLCHFEAGKEKA